MSLALYLKNQQEQTTQLARVLEGIQGPLPNWIRTPLTTDGKFSRTSTMNSTPQARKLQQRHSPTVHREVGKKYATFSDAKLERFAKTFWPILKYPTTAALGYAAYRGTNDDDHVSYAKGMSQVGAQTAGIGALAGLAHQLIHPKYYNKLRQRLYVPVVAGALTGAFGAGTYALSKTTDPLLERLIYEKTPQPNSN